MDKPRLLEFEEYSSSKISFLNRHYRVSYEYFSNFTKMDHVDWVNSKDWQDYNSHKQWYYSKFSKLGRVLE